jgi:hypothetical protein
MLLLLLPWLLVRKEREKLRKLKLKLMRVSRSKIAKAREPKVMRNCLLDFLYTRRERLDTATKWEEGGEWVQEKEEGGTNMHDEGKRRRKRRKRRRRRGPAR